MLAQETSQPDIPRVPLKGGGGIGQSDMGSSSDINEDYSDEGIDNISKDAIPNGDDYSQEY